MALKVQHVAHIMEVNRLLRGAISFPKNFKGNERIYGLDGLTLVFSSPVGTATFADAADAGLTPVEIMAQIKADIADVTLTLLNGVLWVEDADASAAVVLDGTTSTAAAVFGFPAANVSGTLYAAPGDAAPALVSVSDTGRMDGFLVVTEEA